MFVYINECLDKSTEAIHPISFALYKVHMYAQFQRDNIKKYYYDVYDFVKFVKT